MILQQQRACLSDYILGDGDILAGFLAVTGFFDAAEGRLGQG
jgi:hypothetical protein